MAEIQKEEVLMRLLEIEQTHDVKVFFACESGSRAWGFASTDSDYDVRFLFVRKPDWYLSIDLEEKRDVIETPIDGLWDVNGWDIRKALRLLRKSNPPLTEWMQSPIVYREDKILADKVRNALPAYFSPDAAMIHYLHMAQGNFRDYLQGDEVWIKKYFYVLRPLLACRWIERDLGPVPMEFERLANEVISHNDVREAITHLLQSKVAGEELDRGPKIAALSNFIESELNRHANANVTRRRPVAKIEPLSQVFREVLRAAWAV
jgi:predicted nucleotidyltransferase